MVLLLTLLLLVLQFNSRESHPDRVAESSDEDFSKVSNATLGLLPILCNCITTEHGMLSLSVMDLILRSFLMPRTWLPILQNHLQLQLVMLKLQDKTSSSIPMILKFFLTLARVRGGAEMLYCSGFLSSLRVLFAEPCEVFSRSGSQNPVSSYEKSETPQDIWGLGLAVITSTLQSLGDSSSGIGIVNSMIPYFFSEKAHLIFSSLNAPALPSDDHDKKRPRAQRSGISFATLKETEHTLMLMCELAKHWRSWIKAIKDVDRQLREKCIHLLAFISRGTQRLGDLSTQNAPLLCPPTTKEDFEIFLKPSYINSRKGWFALSALGCVSKQKISSLSTAITVSGEASGSTDPSPKTHFSDTVAVQLPMPEILHGLQDQSIAIVTELCASNKLRASQDTQNVCNLMLQILEMALHLELCVVQICGIRPVLGRVDDFSKEVKSLFNAMEGHAFLKASSKSLKHTISCVYPGLLQAENFM
ncbi:hypothetical protein PIB30_039987 [Stylosanthes scabra]|uniref:Uncharacterized protein n=1 Tax=Stylosanthes scabra TaxID=79078 RepID=A0ABU6XC46_9FABA|nr:hypothetical protein [Stylosanthes scabra]